MASAVCVGVTGTVRLTDNGPGFFRQGVLFRVTYAASGIVLYCPRWLTLPFSTTRECASSLRFFSSVGIFDTYSKCVSRPCVVPFLRSLPAPTVGVPGAIPCVPCACSNWGRFSILSQLRRSRHSLCAIPRVWAARSPGAVQR